MSNTSIYAVTGMTCGHCVAAVTKEIQSLEGVERVDVDLDAATATVVGDVSEDLVVEAIAEAGYSASPSA